MAMDAVTNHNNVPLEQAGRFAAWSAAGDAKLETGRYGTGGQIWHMAEYPVRDLVIRKMGYKDVEDLVTREPEDAKWHAMMAAGADAGEGTRWIFVADLMPQEGYSKGNPFDFDSLLGIWELGCWPIGVVKNAGGEKEFVIFVPPIQAA